MKRLFAFVMLLVGLTSGPLFAQPLPEICSRKNCVAAFDGPDRGFCQAYVEGRPCSMAFNDSVDRGWCQHLREGRPCSMGLDGQARQDCEANRVPREHRHWMRLCSSR